MDLRAQEILEQLLRERTPEERERLSRAWERTAAGDPESLPVLFALSDRFSLEAHAALLGEMRRIHESLEGMAREIGKGASVTVERTAAAARSAFESACQFEEFLPRLERTVRGQEEAVGRAIGEVKKEASEIAGSLRAAREEHKSRTGVMTVLFLVVMTALAMGLGFWSGGELRAWRERGRMDQPLPLRMSAGKTR